MIDSGASLNFIDSNLLINVLKVKRLEIPKFPGFIELIDGRFLEAPITQKVIKLRFKMTDFEGELEFTPLYRSNFLVILGLPFLKKFNPDIDYGKNTVTKRPDISSTPDPTSSIKLADNAQNAGAHNAKTLTKKNLPVPKKSLTNDSSPIKNHFQNHDLDPRVYFLNALTRSVDNEFQDIPINHQELLFFEKDDFLDPKAVKKTDKNLADIGKQIPAEYHKYLTIFSEDGVNKLPNHSEHDLKIQLLPESKPPWGPIYQLTEKESKELRKYLDKNLQRGFIRTSKSPAGAPILYVPKPDGTL